MTDRKHTAGPWAVFDENSNIPLVKTASGAMLVALPYDGGAPEDAEKLDVTRANAALIARAPDLLEENERLREALNNLLSWFGDTNHAGQATLPRGLVAMGAVNDARAALSQGQEK